MHVVEFAPRLMALQLDEAGGAVLRRRIEELGVVVHTGDVDHEIIGRRRAARSQSLRFADGDELDVDAAWSSRPASARATSWRAQPA